MLSLRVCLPFLSMKYFGLSVQSKKSLNSLKVYFSQFQSEVFGESVQGMRSLNPLRVCILRSLPCYLVCEFRDLFWGAVSWGVSLRCLELYLESDVSELTEGLCLKVLTDVCGDLCLAFEGSEIIEGLWYRFWIWAFWKFIFRMGEHQNLWGSVFRDWGLRYFAVFVQNVKPLTCWSTFYTGLSLRYWVLGLECKLFEFYEDLGTKGQVWYICRSVFRVWVLWNL